LVLYGREESGTVGEADYLEKVQGLVDKVRKAEKAVSDAYAALSQAEEAIYANTDLEEVENLVTAWRDAQKAVNDKEADVMRKRAF
jgi:hypothetical protein